MSNAKNTKQKTTTFTATYKDGENFKWAFYKADFGRDGKWWVLRDYDGYERVLEKTWIDSLPKIKTILDNHDMQAPALAWV